ncbi:hypothetical protein M3Y97_00367000 [Aphelenchoides bicaudatus]|nr:hypothetical protein M3Y97_00367000 [Aphelenchoides bicaudatus]
MNICVIEKNLSTILTAIACYFHNPNAFRNASRNVNKEVFNKRFCKNKNEALSFMGRIKRGLRVANEWIHISASRDPIERFISGFVDKCMTERIYRKRLGTCNNCEDNVTCFVEQEYIRMQRFVRGERVNNFDDRHFFPQNWRCDYAHHLQQYKIIRYSSEKNAVNEFYAQLFNYIRSRNASEADVQFIENQLYGGRTKHTTRASEERMKFEQSVRNDTYLMNYIVRMYYWDFLIFGYQFPELELKPLGVL